MNKLGQYIKKLLPENDTVIIPGFGAFVSKYKPSEINSETGEITPPSKEFFFHRQVRNDDGLLVGYIAKNESLSRSNASKIIKKECESIIYRLDGGEKVRLEEVGEFYLNENNEIQFEPQFKENLLLDSFGLEPVNIIEENIETEPVTTSSPEVEKKTGRLWYLLLIIPFAVAVFFVYGNRQNKVKVQENHQNLEMPEETANAIYDIDSMQVLATDSVEIKEQETNATEPVLNDSARFYLVGGSFMDIKNAEKYIEQFNTEGYEPFYIGQTGSFHLVGIGRYNTKQEAFRAQKDYTWKKPDSGVWVYEKQ